MGPDEVTDNEIERLFAGAATDDRELSQIAAVFDTLRTGDDPDDVTIARWVRAATEALPAVADEAPNVPQPASRPRLAGLRRRAAAIAMSAGVFVAGTSGLAIAADGAKPGDVLYGVDRALESVGIGNGAEQERLEEAEALIDAGKIQQGLQHTTEVLDKDSSEDARASEALRDAAERVETADGAAATATRESVAGLLDYLSENVGQIDGSEVAELAVEIGGPGDHPETPATTEDKEPPGRPADLPSDPPGLTDREPGPPADVPANPPGHSDEKPGKPKKDK